MNLYNHHHPATKNNLLSTPNLKLMVLLLALATSVGGSTKTFYFSVAGHFLDGNVNVDIIKG